MDYCACSLCFCIAVIVIGATVWYMKYGHRPRVSVQSAHEEKVRAELLLLKLQLHPHLLLSGLGYIRDIAYPISDQLTDSIDRFSQLMRYALTEIGSHNTSLQEEATNLKNLIATHQLRFGEDFNASFIAEGNLNENHITAFLLISLAANAFTYGVVNDAERPVRIILKVLPAYISFAISYKTSNLTKGSSADTVLANIRRQLELTYPNRHELLVSANGQTCKNTLIIKPATSG